MGETKEKKKRSIIKRIKERAELFGNKAKYAIVGAGYCLRRPKYLIAFIISTVFFLYILTFFRDGNSNWLLLWSGLSSGRKFELIERVFLEMFTNFASFYGVLLFFLSLLQGLTVAQIIYTWRNRRKSDALSGVGRGGVASLLGFAAMGCPGCGVSFLTPILTAIIGTGASFVAERVSIILAIVAFALLIYANINLGYIIFIIAGNGKHKKEK